ncbi:MAG TPA: DUF177 domain-containing protein [Afifellaceae bacterium]|nr:DUF177 domain-containing protein [Afifellaceae bacterium]
MAESPLSHTVLARDIGPGGRTEHVAADAEERAALAGIFGIPEVRAVAAEFELRPASGGAFRIRGVLDADVVQTCVVTLAPVEQHVHDEIDVTLVPGETAGNGETVLIDPLAEDAPEIFHRGRIDLGAVVAEHLALALDPYPRAPGVEFEPHIEDEPADRVSPFAALQRLRQRDRDGQ